MGLGAVGLPELGCGGVPEGLDAVSGFGGADGPACEGGDLF